MSIPKPAPSGPRLLPSLEPGHGERRTDCASYGDCLGRYVRATWTSNVTEPAGRCPSGCTSHSPAPAWEAVAAAHHYGPHRHPLADIQEGDVEVAEPIKKRKA